MAALRAGNGHHLRHRSVLVRAVMTAARAALRKRRVRAERRRVVVVVVVIIHRRGVVSSAFVVILRRAVVVSHLRCVFSLSLFLFGLSAKVRVYLIKNARVSVRREQSQTHTRARTKRE